MCKICHSSPCLRRCPNYQPKIVFYCDCCEKPIYEGDPCYTPGDNAYCEDCIVNSETIAEADDGEF